LVNMVTQSTLFSSRKSKVLTGDRIVQQNINGCLCKGGFSNTVRSLKDKEISALFCFMLHIHQTPFFSRKRFKFSNLLFDTSLSPKRFTRLALHSTRTNFNPMFFAIKRPS